MAITDNILYGSYAEDNQLYFWTARNTAVVKEPGASTWYFKVSPGGSMSQEIDLSAESTVKDMLLTTVVKAVTQGKKSFTATCKVRFTIAYQDGVMDVYLLPVVASLVPNAIKVNKDWLLLENTYAVRTDKKLHKIKIEFIAESGNSALYVNFAELRLDKNVTSTGGSDGGGSFEDNAILYGLDADKPKLR